MLRLLAALFALAALHAPMSAQTEPLRLDKDTTGAVQAGASIAQRGDTMVVGWVDRRFPGQGNVMFRVSLDGGDTFSEERRIDLDATIGAGLNRGVELSLDRSGRLHMVWIQRVGFLGHGLFYAIAELDGSLVAAPRTLSEDDGGAAQDYPAVATGDNHEVFVAWIDGRNQLRGLSDYTELYFRRSTDGGATFENPRIIGNYGEVDGGACECCNLGITYRDGQVAVAYRSNINNYRDIYLVRSFDIGESFQRAIMVPDERWQIFACPMAGPSIALDAAGRTHVVWKDQRPSVGGSQPVFYASVGRNDTVATADLRLTAGNEQTNYPSIAVSAEGRIHVAWQGSTGGGIHVFSAYSIDGGNSFVGRGPMREGDLMEEAPRTAVSGSRERALTVWASGTNRADDIWYALSDLDAPLVAPEIPVQILPAEQGVIAADAVFFSWATPANMGNGYQVFYDLRVTGPEDRVLRVNGNNAVVTGLPPGDFTWSVRATTLTGTSEWSPWQAFRHEPTTDVMEMNSEKALDLR